MSVVEMENQLAAVDRLDVERCQAGDNSAFAELYERYHDRLVRYCRYRLRDQHEAEDVVQEAFARAWRSLPTFSGDRRFYPWLRVIAGNLCTDTLRKRGRSEPSADVDPGVVDDDFDHLTDAVDLRILREALAKLNDRHRQALSMREEQGLSYEEIALRAGVSTSTVESLLWRARQSLKREFQVLSKREGLGASIPFLAPALRRLWSRARAANVRIIRRAHMINRASSDVPGLHLAVVAVVGLITASVIAVSGSIGGPGSRAPTQAVVSGAGPTNAAATTSATSTATASPRTTPQATGNQPVRAAEVGPASTEAPGGGSTISPVAIRTPLTFGHAAGHEARTDPISVQAGPVAVGVDPKTVQSFTVKAGTVSTSVVGSTVTNSLAGVAAVTHR